MRLQEYKTSEEKKGAFKKHLTVRTPLEFEKMCDECEALEKQNKQRFLFRGLNSARYKLYSSAQRLWNERDISSIGLSFEEYVHNLLETFKDKSSLLLQYFTRLGVIQNDWLILSVLQHYGAGTPLLDFTKNFNAALFFALDGMSKAPGEGLDNYVSVYYYKMVDVANGISSSINKLAKERAKKYSEWDSSGQLWMELSYENLMRDNRTLIVPTYTHQSNLRGKGRKQVSVYTVANLNSTAQEGEFVCNGSESCPLEDLWKKGDTRYLSCIDIHKGLYEYILYRHLKVSSMEIARKKYYPSESDIVMQLQTMALSK